jgi:hypothetical protein
MCYERIKNLRRSSLSILRNETTAVAAKGEIVKRAASISNSRIAERFSAPAHRQWIYDGISTCRNCEICRS